MPPMQIRNSAIINGNLGLSALPYDFLSIPVRTFINPDINDQLSWAGCSYATDTVQNRRYDNSLYNDFWWVADFAR